MLKITVSVKSDISTVYAYFTQEYLDSMPERGYGPYGKIEKRRCDSWSCFNGDYKRGQEREFIETVASEKYSSYHISWVNCN